MAGLDEMLKEWVTEMTRQAKAYESFKPSTIPDDRKKEYERWKKALPTAKGQTWVESEGYDLQGAFLAEHWPVMSDDGYYHLHSIDPRSGKVLKRPGTKSYDLFREEEKRRNSRIVLGPDGREYALSGSAFL